MRLTVQDASFIYGETASGPMHGVAISVIEGVVPFERIYRHFESRIHLVPRFRQRLAFVPFNLAHARWVDDPGFDLDNHLKHLALPDGTTLSRAIEQALELGEPLLDRARPLWLSYVLSGVPDRTLLVQMGHHAMVDGASGVDISMVMFDLEPHTPAPPPPAQAWKPAPLPSALDLVSEALAEMQTAPAPLPLPSPPLDPAHAQALRRGVEVMTRLGTQPVMTAPWNAGSVGPKRIFEHTQYPFGEFREIRRVFGGTLNDVVLTVVTESAARYLVAHNEFTTNQNLRLMCPVNVRREDEKGALGNRVSAMYPVVPATPMDVVERLKSIIRQTERIKANQEPQALEYLMETAPAVPPVSMAQTLLVGTPFDPTAWLARVPPPVPPGIGPRPPLFGFNFTCTNVPGVQVPQYIAGHRILTTFATLMLGGTLGYGVAVMSYNQTLIFNLVSDPRLLPDLQLMRTGIEAVFAELQDRAHAQMTGTKETAR
jgi:diacylglycerol O-acyltransferase